MQRLISGLVTIACVGVTWDVRAQTPPAPTAPSAAAPSAAPPSATAAPAAAASTPVARDRSGVVLVERAGRVLALGLILNEDGRVLTAASRVSGTGAGPLFVRYADGKLVQARVGHADAERDLALLVPKTLATRKGILASRGKAPDPGSVLAGFTSGPNRNVTPLDYTVKSVEALGRALVLELSPVPKPVDVGGPLLDARGQAVAVIVGGCLGPAEVPAPVAPAQPPNAGDAKPPTPAASPQPCTKNAVGLPVAAVRSFLKALPPDAAAQGPWLGVDGISADTGVVRGVRIGRIEPKSPVSTLGLQVTTEDGPGDLLVAVGGKPVPTVAALERTLAGYSPGDRVDLLVFGKDGYKIFQVRLADPPPRSPGAP